MVFKYIFVYFRLSPGQESHGSHMSSIETRLSSHDSMEGISTIRHDSQMAHAHELAMDGHDMAAHMEDNSHISSRLNHELENRLTPHDNHINSINDKRLENHILDTRINGRIEPHDMAMEHHMNGLDRDMNGMENRMGAHENHNMSHHDLNHHHHHVAMMQHHHPENHMQAHMGHPHGHGHMTNPHDHIHMQGLHHPHPHPHHPHMYHLHHPHIKCDSMDDPYSFVDEDGGAGMGNQIMNQQPRPSPILLQPVPKKRGRKKKIKPEDG